MVLKTGLLIPIPNETHVMFQNAETGAFSQPEAASEQAIDLLQERFTALISGAVTGKIDVREFAYQETA